MIYFFQVPGVGITQVGLISICLIFTNSNVLVLKFSYKAGSDQYMSLGSFHTL